MGFDHHREVKNMYRMTAIIGGAMAASVFIYAGVVEFLVRFGKLGGFNYPLQQAEFLRIIFMGIAIANYALIVFLRGRNYAAVRNIPPERFPAALGKLYNGAIISFAISESVAILGLVFFFLTGDRLNFYVFMAVSVLFFIIFFPRLSAWQKIVNK